MNPPERRPSLPVLFVMAGIVAVLILVPGWFAIAGLCRMAFDLPWLHVLTFGERFSEPMGLLVWWLLALLPAGAWTAFVTAKD